MDDHIFTSTHSVFIAPLLSNTVHESPERSDSCTVQVLGLILELLSFFVEHHTYHIKNYILHKGIRCNIFPQQLKNQNSLFAFDIASKFKPSNSTKK